jgi:hypothetical protein
VLPGHENEVCGVAKKKGPELTRPFGREALIVTSAAQKNVTSCTEYMVGPDRRAAHRQAWGGRSGRNQQTIYGRTIALGAFGSAAIPEAIKDSGLSINAQNSRYNSHRVGA